MSTTARDFDEDQERKKRLKREANRRSAQLSRQRKKAFIEDLKAKNAEFQLAQNVLACHPDLIFAMDGGGRISFANRAAASALNFGASVDLERGSFDDLLDDDSRRRFRGALQAVVGRPPRSSVPLGGPLVVSGRGTSVPLAVVGEVSDSGLLGERTVVCVGRPHRKRPRPAVAAAA